MIRPVRSPPAVAGQGHVGPLWLAGPGVDVAYIHGAYESYREAAGE